MIDQFVVGLYQVDETRIALVGGKGAQLGSLAQLDGVRVPPGFCITTDAFRRFVAGVPSMEDRLEQLSRLAPDDLETTRELSADLRRTLEEAVVPGDLAAAITAGLARVGVRGAYAVRSSATAEDLPTASFAGQQDSYLNVVGRAAVLEHVRRCWASLFTERAVTYRRRHGIDHRSVHMAVVVQQMVPARAAGVMFTADPVTSDRRVVSVEAVRGLGEALVSGLVDPDVYSVRAGEVVARGVGEPVLTDAQVLRLVQLGRRIEAHFGRPQDVEWCLIDEAAGEAAGDAGDDAADDDGFRIVQSRPITTLFPVPERHDEENHVYVSVGHQQMMTDAMKPLGLSFWQLTTPAPMAEAGGRLFVDVTRRLASPESRAALLQAMTRSDPLTGAALATVLERDGYLGQPADAGPPPVLGGETSPIEPDDAVVTELIAQSEASVEACRREIRSRSGEELLDFVRADLAELRRILFDARSHQVFMSAMEAVWWLNDHLETWLGEKNVADTLTQSVPHNVTSEMGLALLDVADVIRRHPAVVALLQNAPGDDLLDRLPDVEGGEQARDALAAWLDRYGMRCPGEIDITRPRWSESPSAIVPTILGNVRNFAPGEAARRFERGRREARQKEQEVLERLRALPDGERKAGETARRIDLARTFIGYREYPKYGMVARYFVYRQALLGEARRLAAAGVLHDPEDVFHLTVDELHDVVRTRRVDHDLVGRRREAFRWYQALTPPRVLTSDGEAVTGSYRRDDVPDGALIGLPVSAGTVEGRARVVLDMARADLEPGDILVTVSTDPSWTPLFVTVAGLVTEVGGLMTHGAVIAREYGLPAVVSVVDATRLIRDGQPIRVHGTDGYVELLR